MAITADNVRNTLIAILERDKCCRPQELLLALGPV